MQIWGVYNEVAMWCLIAFVVSGLYLWLSAQARTWWHGDRSPQVSAADGALDGVPLMYQTIRNIHLLLASFSLPFLVVYGASAVQMSHNSWFRLKPAVQERDFAVAAGQSDARAIAREVINSDSSITAS